MGVVRRTLESLPVLRRAASLLYGRPIEMPKVLLGCAALGLVGGIGVKTERGRKIVDSLWRIGFRDREEEKLPEKEEKKPTVFLDLEEVFLKKKWSFSSLGYVFTIREHAETFLFHLSNAYEIVSVSSLPPELCTEVLEKLDPYGCIKYRMFVKDTDQFSVEKANRERKSSIRVRAKESIFPNDLNVGAWSGTEDETLLLLLDFLLNLSQTETTDLSKVVETYKGKRFVNSYKNIQNEIYPNKRKYFLFMEDAQNKKIIRDINNQRIQEYLTAKEYIENQLRIKNIVK